MTDKEFESIYERQSDYIYKLCCFYLGNASEAQDAVQNIFIKILEKHIKFKNEQHEKAWFHTVARNHCKDIMKSAWWKKKTYIETIPEFPLQENIQPDNSGLENALRYLSIKQKEVIYLYYYKELSINEISKLLKRKESTIQSQLAAGRKRIKEHYK